MNFGGSRLGFWYRPATAPGPGTVLGFDGRPDPTQGASYTVLNHAGNNIGPGYLSISFSGQGVVTPFNSVGVGIDGTEVADNMYTRWFTPPGDLSDSYEIRLASITNIVGGTNRTAFSDFTGVKINPTAFSTAWFPLSTPQTITIYLNNSSNANSFVGMTITAEIAVAGTHTPSTVGAFTIQLGAAPV